MDGWTDGWTGCTDSPCILQEFVPFGATAQPVAQRQEMVIGTLALLWYFVIIAMM